VHVALFPDVARPDGRALLLAPRLPHHLEEIADVTRRTAGASTALDQVLTLPTAPSRRPITVRGRFCGAGLCGNPSGPRPTPEAWVLADTDVAVWVVGRAARGNGWRLDPTYAGDTSRWLEVEGTIERCGPEPCLRARRVELTAAAAATGEN
jgi:hypothetical protein